MILNKTINPQITIKEVNKDFKIILNYVKNNKNINSFKYFSDYELFIYCIIDTFNYGRNFKDSLVNALIHLKNKNNKNNYLGLLLNKDIQEDLI